MPEQFTFALNPGSLGYRVLDPQDSSNCYGVVWHSQSGSNWVTEYPGTHPGSGGGIPGCSATASPSHPDALDRSPTHGRDRVMATFGRITRKRCAQVGHALTAAGLAWEDNGNQDRPELLTYTVTDPYGRRWTVVSRDVV
ncbi:hypothetical protein [Streptomyces mirabilis]|uniref:hypothetical protein n=1 Tax=Streptomyces mirabilis TaxID=68239 RepID=UPI0033D3E45F